MTQKAFGNAAMNIGKEIFGSAEDFFNPTKGSPGVNNDEVMKHLEDPQPTDPVDLDGFDFPVLTAGSIPSLPPKQAQKVNSQDIQILDVDALPVLPSLPLPSKPQQNPPVQIEQSKKSSQQTKSQNSHSSTQPMQELKVSNIMGELEDHIMSEHPESEDQAQPLAEMPDITNEREGALELPEE